MSYLLKERPWLFDRKVMHNGYLNTYSFSRYGKKNDLSPLKALTTPQNVQAHSNLFLTFGAPLHKASYHEFKAFKEWILTSLDESETPSPSHPLAIALLEPCSYLFLGHRPRATSKKIHLRPHIPHA